MTADLVRAIAALVGSFAIVVTLIPPCIRLAVRLGLCDRPGGRKVHANPTPYLGGAAILLGVLVTSSPFDHPGHFAAVVGSAVLLGAVGTLDDWRPMKIAPRLAAEAGAGFGLWITGAGWSVTGIPPLDAALTVAWVIVVVNALNWSDGVDGVAGAVGAVAGGSLACLAAVGGAAGQIPFAIAISGACLGFLRFNLVPPARIFLGDGGSMSLGLLIAAAAIGVAEATTTPVIGLPVAVTLVGLPLVDAVFVAVSRRRRGVPVATGGLDHLSHALLARLRTARGVAAALAGGQAGLSVLAVVAATLSDVHAAVVLAGTLGASAFLVAWLQTRPDLVTGPLSVGLRPCSQPATAPGSRGLMDPTGSSWVRDLRGPARGGIT